MFESRFVENPEDRFSRDDAQLLYYRTLTLRCFAILKKNTVFAITSASAQTESELCNVISLSFIIWMKT